MFSFMFVMINSWDAGGLAFFEFDSLSFNGWNILSPNLNLSQVCGGGAGELYVQVPGTLIHSASTLAFTIYASTDEPTD